VNRTLEKSVTREHKNYHKIYKEKSSNKFMNFIKKIFDGKIDETVHLQFQKFSRGEFKNKAMIKARQSKGIFTINTSYEFANELVREAAKKLGGTKMRVTGAIISTNNLKNELDFKDIKQFEGVKRYIIDKEMSGNEIIALLDKFPKAFFALSFDSGDGTFLKIKPKAPKSAKPSSKGEEKPKPDFCKLVTNDKILGRSFVFEDDFKEANINHTFIIDEIIIPEGLRNEKDFAVIRERAKRKGKIIREADIDGKRLKSEKEFIA